MLIKYRILFFKEIELRILKGKITLPCKYIYLNLCVLNYTSKILVSAPLEPRKVITFIGSFVQIIKR